MLTSGITAFRSTGATLLVPLHLSYLAGAYAQLGHYGDAWRSASEAIKIAEATKESWFEAHIHHVAGEIALLWSKLATEKVEEYFERALAVARQQQAKSLELRAAMSMARLWRSQGKPQQARELLAPGLRVVHGGLRHARSEGGEGAAGAVGVIGFCSSQGVSTGFKRELSDKLSLFDAVPFWLNPHFVAPRLFCAATVEQTKISKAKNLRMRPMVSKCWSTSCVVCAADHTQERETRIP